MIIKETLIGPEIQADFEVHPVAAPITIWSPEIIRSLFSGESADFFTTDSRDLSPLVIGVIAMNIMVAKNKETSYPPGLVESSLWNRNFIRYAKRYLFTETGYEASLRSLGPSSFIYLRMVDPLPVDGIYIKVRRVATRPDTDLGCVINGV